jgi:hypothetical protein
MTATRCLLSEILNHLSNRKNEQGAFLGTLSRETNWLTQSIHRFSRLHGQALLKQLQEQFHSSLAFVALRAARSRANQGKHS